MISTEFLKVLEEQDVPFIPSIWEYIERTYSEDKRLKKYLNLMKLPAYRVFTWKDSKFWEED